MASPTGGSEARAAGAWAAGSRRRYGYDAVVADTAPPRPHARPRPLPSRPLLSLPPHSSGGAGGRGGAGRGGVGSGTTVGSRRTRPPGARRVRPSSRPGVGCPGRSGGRGVWPSEAGLSQESGSRSLGRHFRASPLAPRSHEGLRTPARHLSPQAVPSPTRESEPDRELPRPVATRGRALRGGCVCVSRPEGPGEGLRGARTPGSVPGQPSPRPRSRSRTTPPRRLVAEDAWGLGSTRRPILRSGPLCPRPSPIGSLTVGVEGLKGGRETTE